MKNTLRSKVIRLAHTNPELRSTLLPLIKAAGCEKLPEGGMRDNCEKKKEEGEKKEAKTAAKNTQFARALPQWRKLENHLKDDKVGLGLLKDFENAILD